MEPRDPHVIANLENKVWMRSVGLGTQHLSIIDSLRESLPGIVTQDVPFVQNSSPKGRLDHHIQASISY
jgi:hypothetical protein